MELPYRAEYSKSGRASCRGCKSAIAKDVLRLAVMVQSPMFDGRTPQWYHAMCFFGKQRPKSVDDIEHYGSLRWEDQKMIKDKIATASAAIIPGKKGTKRNNAARIALKDFLIEYSKSSRAYCRGCEQKIMKDEVRISKKDFETDVGKKYGGQDMWHHVTCFARLRSELGYFESAAQLPGYILLKKEDQKEASKAIPAVKQEGAPDTKKLKEEPSSSNSDEKLEKQSKIIFKYRDMLKNNLKKGQLIELLEFNRQEVPVGEERILDRLSDIMTFGALLPCDTCKGQFVYNDVGYICKGDLTEWTKCNKIEPKPKRTPFKIPSHLSEQHSFLKAYKYVSRERVLREIKSPSNFGLANKGKDDPDGDKPKVERSLPALYNMQFVILGKPQSGKDVLKKEITRLGGKVITKISRSVMAVIATVEEVEKMGARISEAQLEDVHVVSEDFVNDAKEYVGKIPELVLKKSICNWGCDPNLRLPAAPSKSASTSKSRSLFKSKPGKIKLKLKGGGAVDPDSGLDEVAHIYQKGSVKYNAVLGITDVQQNKNSFYKLQLLEADGGNRYWLFRAWGRIGTTIGGHKLEKMDSLYEAQDAFEELYLEKSGNDWENRKNFVKVPGRMYPIDIDYGEDEVTTKMEISSAVSTLPGPVQHLMRLIFDVKAMKDLMLEFELDTEKMPLGKLSKSQIQHALKVLTELQDLISTKSPVSKIIDATNRFYTLVPHSFGIDNPPLIDDEETIKKKVEMLDSLMEIEIAYNMMKSVGTNNDMDNYYTQLKTDITVIDKDTEEFRLIHDYVKNTHAQTHSTYELDVVQVFMVKRHGEDLRYKPFRKLHNRKLLWHGSRLTNYAGILSQGLRIAPPEAPVTGYMFGKGIYFADMVSKSANYCYTSPVQPTGLLLLTEVALGNMHELQQAENIVKLPKGKHSTKGIGKTYPDPKESKILDGVEVPLGKPIQNKKVFSSLLYNEYIVYDVAQVNVRYLLNVEFKYKY